MVKYEFVSAVMDSADGEPIRLLFVGEAITAAAEVGEFPDGSGGAIRPEVGVVDVADVVAVVNLEDTFVGDEGLTAAASVATAC